MDNLRVQWIIVARWLTAPDRVTGWEVAQRIGFAFDGLLVARNLFDLLKRWMAVSANRGWFLAAAEW
jgi:hypothetical protein